ncbi:MAG: hypothetical protein H3C53_06885, partial [Trueperaceae bacterium]|nr:hypothetical protein [Trueperaceae bacterium]
TRIIDDRLEKAGLEVNAQAALTELSRIHRVPIQHAGLTITKTTTPDPKQQQILTAIGTLLPAQHTM